MSIYMTKRYFLKKEKEEKLESTHKMQIILTKKYQ